MRLKHYFFLSTTLPALSLDKKPDIDFEELMFLFEQQLNSGDLKNVNDIRTYYDLKNVFHNLDQDEFEPYGNLSRIELEEALSEKALLPDYLFEYLKSYDDEVELRRHFSSVFVQFFKEMSEKSHGFLRRFFSFERQLRLVLSCARAIAMGRDVAELLQYEDSGDDFVAWLLVQKDAGRFEYPIEYQPLKKAIEEAGDNPFEQYKAVNRYKFRYFADLYLEKPFSLDALIVYMVQLIQLESIHRLDSLEGKHLVTRMSKE